MVQAIIREFSRNPPQLLEDNSPPSTVSHIGMIRYISNLNSFEDLNWKFKLFFLQIYQAEPRRHMF